MYKINGDQMQNFINKYGIHDVVTKRGPRRSRLSDLQGFNGTAIEDIAWATDDMYRENIVNLKLPADALDNIVWIVEEWNSLYNDSESARLLHEARFINKLRRGL